MTLDDNTFTAMMADARSYLSRHLSGTDMSSFDDTVIRSCIESSYPGGWADFESDFMRTMIDTQRAFVRRSTELSPIKKKAMVEHFTRRKLREHDAIISADFGETDMKFVLSRATVDYKSRRDVITARTLELHVFTRPDATSKWSHQMIDTTSEVDDQFIRWGAVNTPERDAVIREQVETCYRPGSEKTPMQGWVARLEVSHKQAHANETFQSPKKPHTA